MKSTKISSILVLFWGLMVFQSELVRATPIGTVITYPGRLTDNNKPAYGLYDFQFKLYGSNDPCPGAHSGSTIDINDNDLIEVNLEMNLDFGSGIFTCESCWWEIMVRPGERNSILPKNVRTWCARRKLSFFYGKKGGSNYVVETEKNC